MPFRFSDFQFSFSIKSESQSSDCGSAKNCYTDYMITPRTLKGFRDFLPDFMLPRERLIETATDVYRSYGFCPIDTPALEYLEILLGKVWRGENTQAG